MAKNLRLGVVPTRINVQLMYAKIPVMLSIAFALMASIGVSQTPPITVQSLLREMSDRSQLARLPEVPYKQLQASSHDKLKTNPNDPMTWHSNADYGQFIRTEQHQGRTEWVVMEHRGPGAITRIWTPLLADKDKMLVRIYFDGSDRPTIEEPFNDSMRGRNLFKPPFAFIAWPNSGPASGPASGPNSGPDKDVESGVGSDLYYPMPFAAGCKVTMSEVPFYYSIAYRSYPVGTAVETYSAAAVKEATDFAQGVGRDLSHPLPFPTKVTGSKAVKLRSGGDLLLHMQKGPSALEAIQLQFDRTPDLEELRSTVIEMHFDGERTVWCPLGEFFGCGIHDRPVWDRFRTVGGNNEMSCAWTMPYRRSAQIQIHNLGAKPIGFKVGWSAVPWKWDERSLHFHAAWRYQYPIATRPKSDWNYLAAAGQGVYVGDTLTVFNPVPAWYGEGDERIYVDGEKFPSHLGTGTEDYYGYAWGMAEHYSSPFIAMPERDLKGRDNWTGFTTTSRVRGLDAIPFEKSLRFDMEIWNWADCNVGYSAATFWYARPGATSNREPMPKEATAPLPQWSAGIKGAIECENMKVLSKSDDVQASTQSGALSAGHMEQQRSALFAMRQARKLDRASGSRTEARSLPCDSLCDEELRLCGRQAHAGWTLGQGSGPVER